MEWLADNLQKATKKMRKPEWKKSKSDVTPCAPLVEVAAELHYLIVVAMSVHVDLVHHCPTNSHQRKQLDTEVDE